MSDNNEPIYETDSTLMNPEPQIGDTADVTLTNTTAEIVVAKSQPARRDNRCIRVEPNGTAVIDRFVAEGLNQGFKALVTGGTVTVAYETIEIEKSWIISSTVDSYMVEMPVYA